MQLLPIFSLQWVKIIKLLFFKRVRIIYTFNLGLSASTLDSTDSGRPSATVTLDLPERTFEYGFEESSEQTLKQL